MFRVERGYRNFSFKFWMFIPKVHAGLLATFCLAGAHAIHAQTPAYVQATTRFTAVQAGATVQGHPQFLFLKQDIAGGTAYQDAFFQSYEVTADLREGFMAGTATLLNRFQITDRRTELKAHFMPRYRVELAPGNTVNVVIPVEWRVRLKKYRINFTEVAAGSDNWVRNEAKFLLSAQAPSSGGILAQATYTHRGDLTGSGGQTFSTTKEVRTQGTFTVQEGIALDPDTFEPGDYFHLATANNGSGSARIEYALGSDDQTGFSEVYLTVRHNARPGNGVAFLIWFEVEGIVSAYGGGGALKWEDFEISYTVPEGYRIVSTDGQDLSALNSGNTLPPPAVVYHPITGWQWLPESKSLQMTFPGADGQPLEIQKTTDLLQWRTVRRIEGAAGTDPVQVSLGSGLEQLGLPPESAFYRVILPGQ